MNKSPNPNLYISYSGKDKELITRLAGDLENNSIHVQYDGNLISDGGDWQKSLMKGISEADCVLVLISPNSANSQYVMNELGMARAFALKEHKLLLPVIYGNAEIPLFIKDIQSIFWRDNYEDVVERITKAVFNATTEPFIGESIVENELEDESIINGSFEKSESIPQQKAPTKKVAPIPNATSKNSI